MGNARTRESNVTIGNILAFELKEREVQETGGLDPLHPPLPLPRVRVHTTIQYNTITLFKEGSAITFYSFLTYGPQKNR